MVRVLDRLEPTVPKATTMPRGANEDIGAYLGFPQDHPAVVISHGDIERVTAEVDQRAKVVRLQHRRTVATGDGRSP